MLSFQIQASMSIPAICPERFSGKVTAINDSEEVDHYLAKQKVKFVDVKVKAGEVSENPTVELLKYGPLQVQIGQRYYVELNKGKICKVIQETESVALN